MAKFYSLRFFNILSFVFVGFYKVKTDGAIISTNLIGSSMVIGTILAALQIGL